jgi:hypothetical protein
MVPLPFSGGSNMFQGVFAKMKFDPYGYKEYPKWIETKSGRKIIVHSPAEEQRAKVEDAPSDGELSATELERNNLAKLVAELRAENANLQNKIAGPMSDEDEVEDEVSKIIEPPKGSDSDPLNELLGDK